MGRTQTEGTIFIVATESDEKRLPTTAPVSESLLSEYEAIFARAGQDARGDQVVAVLVREAEWTEQGATEVLQLAQKYGTSILRNALALAAVMNIEDGEPRL